MSLAGRLTWVGHSTVHLELDGFRLLTDPLLRRRVAHLRRRVELPSAAVASVDAVLISHVHMDHLHRRSLALVDRSASVVLPKGSRSLLDRLAFADVVEVAVGDRIRLGPATIEVVTADHRSGRGPHSRIDSTPVGFVVDIAGHRTYFAGDTDLFDGMGSLGAIDVALLPIWGWGPSIGPGHLDPARAAEATERIDPGMVVPIHWGTYTPEDLKSTPSWLHDPADRFADALDERGLASRLRRLRPGEALSL